jgi:hypothetical protein
MTKMLYMFSGPDEAAFCKLLPSDNVHFSCSLKLFACDSRELSLAQSRLNLREVARYFMAQITRSNSCPVTAGFARLFILFTPAFSDYLTRQWH